MLQLLFSSTKRIVTVCALAASLPAAQAQDADTPATPPETVSPPATTTTAVLTDGERAGAVRVDELTIPTPGEFFAAIDKQGQPSWPSQYREPIPLSFTNRAQIAMNLGGLLTDGFIAVAARDSQRVKNTGKDIIGFAKALGVSENVISRGNTITAFAETSQWEALEEELEATQNEVKLAMVEQKDDPLVTLVSLGAWIRGVQVVSGLVAANHDPQTASLLRQPALVDYLHGKLGALPDRLKNDPLVKDVDLGLLEIEKLVSFPAGESPSVENVKLLHDAAGKLVGLITTKTK